MAQKPTKQDLEYRVKLLEQKVDAARKILQQIEEDAMLNENLRHYHDYLKNKNRERWNLVTYVQPVPHAFKLRTP